MNKQEIIKLLREWGNGDFSRLPNNRYSLCYNASVFCITALTEYLVVTYDDRHEYPVDGKIKYYQESVTGTLWQNPKRLQLCLDFADWLEERE